MSFKDAFSKAKGNKFPEQEEETNEKAPKGKPAKKGGFAQAAKNAKKKCK